MPFQTTKYPLPVKSETDKSESSKWIHYNIHDNLQIRILKEALEKVEQQQAEVTTPYAGTLPYLGPSGFMFASIGIASSGSTHPILGYVHEIPPFEIIDIGDKPHKIKLAEEDAIKLAKLIFQHFELEKMGRKAEDYFGGLVKELEHHVVTERGWDLVKDLLPADKLDALQRGEMIELKGSDDHRWLINAKGGVYRDADKHDEKELDLSNLEKLAKVIRGDQRKGTRDEERPLEGRISDHYYSDMGWVFPDKLAALIRLIQHDAHRLVRKWGCGNLYLEGGDVVDAPDTRGRVVGGAIF